MHCPAMTAEARKPVTLAIPQHDFTERAGRNRAAAGSSACIAGHKGQWPSEEETRSETASRRNQLPSFYEPPEYALAPTPETNVLSRSDRAFVIWYNPFIAATDVRNTAHDLETAGADPRLATAIAHAIRVASPPVSQWPISVIAAVLVVAIGIAGAGVYKNGDRIDANRDRINALTDRISSLEVSMSERLTRIEALLSERLPERH